MAAHPNADLAIELRRLNTGYVDGESISPKERNKRRLECADAADTKCHGEATTPYAAHPDASSAKGPCTGNVPELRPGYNHPEEPAAQMQRAGSNEAALGMSAVFHAQAFTSIAFLMSALKPEMSVFLKSALRSNHEPRHDHLHDECNCINLAERVQD